MQTQILTEMGSDTSVQMVASVASILALHALQAAKWCKWIPQNSRAIHLWSAMLAVASAAGIHFKYEQETLTITGLSAAAMAHSLIDFGRAYTFNYLSHLVVDTHRKVTNGETERQ